MGKVLINYEIVVIVVGVVDVVVLVGNSLDVSFLGLRYKN